MVESLQDRLQRPTERSVHQIGDPHQAQLLAAGGELVEAAPENWVMLLNSGLSRRQLLKAIIGVGITSFVEPFVGSERGAAVRRRLWDEWIPLRLKGNIIQCWGRTYVLGSLGLPESIISLSNELLASSVRFVINGKSDQVKGVKMTLLKVEQDVIRCRSRGIWRKEVPIEILLTAEFDGMLRLDCSFQAGIDIQYLAVEFPLRREIAQFYHYFPGRWGDVANSGAVEDLVSHGLWRSQFKPYVWLGNDDCGLAWFTESNCGWAGAFPLEIDAKGEEVVFRVVLRDGTGKPLREGFNFTFGLQATPVKPLPSSYFRWRLAHRAYYGIEDEMYEIQQGRPVTVLKKAAELGVKNLIFFHTWTDRMSDFRTPYEAKLKRLVTQAHQEGIGVLLYFGNLISTLSREWTQLGQSAVVEPRQRYVTSPIYVKEGMPVQTAYTVCFGNEWARIALNGIAKLLDEYEVDGLYLDGCATPRGCHNALHGHGCKVGEDKNELTYPFFAVRDFMKSLWKLVKSGNPPRLLVGHQSGAVLAPTIAFVDTYWDGEQLGSGYVDGGEVLRVLPLSTFRAEFVGKAIGVPAHFLYHRRFSARTGLALALLHGVMVIPTVIHRKRAEFEMIARLWKAFDSYGAGWDNWVPYWQEHGFWRVSPDTVKVSGFLRAGKEALLVLVNCASEPTVAQVQISLGSRKVQALEIESGSQLTVEGGAFKVGLSPMDPKFVLIR